MSKKSAKHAEKLLQDIRKVARLDGNKQCVDCPEKVLTAFIFHLHFPFWYSFSLVLTFVMDVDL